ncbi:right-handed parallel beta-helix repeat-containing protein [Desertivirga xinjiangensis]|uniref:right-handed parallel beta-helix repeat-containing protein n=1 Tax=Desertivirga xinjiangensis TaxID=539206 RepID=UPI0021093E6F|nr:right-handed parallel beta-helix repeat-containing protein [Pedobacter xinjiangensis]
MKKLSILCLLMFGFTVSQARPIKISSLAELNKYAQEDNQKIVLKPGTYHLEDYLNADSITAKLNRKDFQYFTFRGNNNSFTLKGVKLVINTRLREKLKFPIHTNEIIVKGDNNVLEGLEIVETENGLSPGGAVLEIAGKGNTIKDFSILVTGSFPYGYGDLFGKGGPDVIRHKKQSGFLVTGSFTRVYNVTLKMRAYGHGFFIQKDAGNVHFENCYVEGELRKTDDVLKETSGPAFDVQFRTWTANREGKYIVTPGYMKSLCEDGFRTYGQNKNVTFKNCTAKNTRGGFELRTNGGVVLENCTTIGTERAYWVGNNAVIRKSRGDANYGPLLFVEGSNVDVELEVLPDESDRIVHALATIQGTNNNVILLAKQERKQQLPILVGYTHPEHGESMSPYGQAPAVNLQLVNDTAMPVVIGKASTDSRILTKGEVRENLGTKVSVAQKTP